MESFEILSNGMKLLQRDDLFRLGTDSMLLADFCLPLSGVKVADLGCGSGALGVLLCAAEERCEVTGIELQERACDLARENIRLNGLSSRLRVLHADLRAIREVLPANAFDVVVANPPYFPVRSGVPSGEEAIAIARTERCCTLDELCVAAQWLLRYAGRFCLVHRPERMAELMFALRSHQLEPKRLRFVRHRADKVPSLLLLESRRNGKPGLTLLPDLILWNDDGTETEEYQRIYHM